MALGRYGAERYRCFVEPVAIDLRPLTLLFGLNASGKSALARVLPLLAASARHQGDQPLDLTSRVARGATYRDIATRLSDRNALIFTLAWTDEDVSELTVQMRAMPEQNRHIIEDLRVKLSGHELRLLFDPDEHGDRYVLSWRGRRTTAGVTFAGLQPATGAATTRKVAAQLDGVRARLASFARDVHWLTAVRVTPPRNFQPRRDWFIDENGGGIEHAIAQDWLGPRTLIGRVNEVFGRMFRHELRIDETVEGMSLVVIPHEGAPVSTAVADTGEGASQVLPVLVLAALAETGQLGPSPVLVLEQPEMHLHPSAERELGALLARVATVPGVRLLVETHSENLLLFIQLAVARQVLAHDHVGIYFVRRRQEGGSVVDPILLDEVGRAKAWPPGVFSEDVALARELLLEQRARTIAQ